MSDAPEKAEAHDKDHKGHGGGGGRGHGPGGGHEEGHEGAPEWLISFADMVMLMMGFFVILFALNNKPTGRQPGGAAPESEGGDPPANADVLDFTLGVREAFNNPVDINSNNPRDAALIKRMLQRAGKSEAHDPGLSGKDQDVQSLNRGDYYALSGSVPFGEGSSELLADALPTITEMAKKVRGRRLVVEVRGHVSSVEASRGPDVAMRLAAERALTVSKALAVEGVDPWQLRLVICADNDRLQAYPTSRDVDKANSRVEVILTDQVVPDEVPTRYEDAANSSSAWTPAADGGSTAQPLPKLGG